VIFVSLSRSRPSTRHSLFSHIQPRTFFLSLLWSILSFNTASSPANSYPKVLVPPLAALRHSLTTISRAFFFLFFCVLSHKDVLTELISPASLSLEALPFIDHQQPIGSAAVYFIPGALVFCYPKETAISSRRRPLPVRCSAFCLDLIITYAQRSHPGTCARVHAPRSYLPRKAKSATGKAFPLTLVF
jgi:hypothetical protein